MVSMTYIYVKKDLTFLEGSGRQTLLKAFLRAMYIDEYITDCEKELGFVRVAGFLRDLALSTIDSLVTSADAPEWTFEFNTERRLGQEDFVISTKRRTYAEIIQNNLVDSVHILRQDLAAVATSEDDAPSTTTSAPVEAPPAQQDPETLQQIGSLLQDVATLTARNEAASQDVEALQLETERLAAQNMAMSQLVEDLAAGIANMTTHNEEAMRRISNITTHNEEAMRRIEELETMVDDHSHDFEDTGNSAGADFSKGIFWMMQAVGCVCWGLAFAA
jgi:hypothetical protein